jgi:hypothetical protein
VCSSKHVEHLKILGIINSITKLHFVGISTEELNVLVIDVAVCLIITIILRSVLVLVINVTKFKCENTQ